MFWATSDKEWNPYLTELEENEQSCSLVGSRSKKNDVVIESHFRWLQEVNTRGITEVEVAGDGLLIDRFVR